MPCPEEIFIVHISSCITETLTIKTGNSNEFHKFIFSNHLIDKRGKVEVITEATSDVNGDIVILISSLPEGYINPYNMFYVEVEDQNGNPKEIGEEERKSKFSVYPSVTYGATNDVIEL